MFKKIKKYYFNIFLNIFFYKITVMIILNTIKDMSYHSKVGLGP
jgi:hypothetical protein